MNKITSVLFFFFMALSAFLPAQTCEEGMVFEIDRIKQETETALINATTMNVSLETGESLLVFYVDGHMIKISVEKQESYLSAELFFRDGFIRHISEDVQEEGEMLRNYYYFMDDRLICYRNEKAGDYKDNELYSIAEKKWLERVEKYLQAIQ
jgi:hypothetical protein